MIGPNLFAVFSSFKQRRAGEGDEGRVGQRLAHALVVLAAMAAVALVDQHDQVRRRRCGTRAAWTPC